MRGVTSEATSQRAAALADRLETAFAELIDVMALVDPVAWEHVPGDGVWAIGKDVEHVIEAVGYHAWIVHRTIGTRVSSRKPVLERGRLTTGLTPAEAVAELRSPGAAAASLLRGLTDEQLGLETRPPRARSQVLAQTIEDVMIGHVGGHRRDIEGKLARRG